MPVEMQLPAPLAARLALIVRDLEATAGVGLSFRDEPCWDEGPSCMLWEESGSGRGILFHETETEADDVAELADRIQDTVIDSRWFMSIKPVAWPECPVHRSHPLEARAENNEAVWVCPKDSTVRVRIGSLAKSRR